MVKKMDAVWKGKIVEVLRINKKNCTILYKKKKYDVKKTELISIGDADKIKDRIFALYKGEKVFVEKIYRKSALIRPKPPYKNKKRVYISDLIVYNIQKISYNLLLKNALNLVISVHYDILKKNFNEIQLKTLSKTKIEFGRKTYRNYGNYSYNHNRIRINNHTLLDTEEFLNTHFVRICQTIYHEILHLKYKNHLDGMFHHLEKQFRKEKIEEWCLKWKI